MAITKDTPQLTYEDFITILEGINSLIISAQRQQNAKRGQPYIKEVYKTHEAQLKVLEAKCLAISTAMRS